MINLSKYGVNKRFSFEYGGYNPSAFSRFHKEGDSPICEIVLEGYGKDDIFPIVEDKFIDVKICFNSVKYASELLEEIKKEEVTWRGGYETALLLEISNNRNIGMFTYYDKTFTYYDKTKHYAKLHVLLEYYIIGKDVILDDKVIGNEYLVCEMRFKVISYQTLDTKSVERENKILEIC